VQQLGALGAQHAFDNFDTVIQDVGVRQSKLAANSAKAKIASAEHQTGYTRRHQRACAHHAGLQRRVHCGAFQPVIAGRGGRLAHGQDFCVRGRIVACYWRISAASDDAAVQYDHCADRDLPPAFGVTRQFQRLPNKIFVGQKLHRYAFDDALDPGRRDDVFQPETGGGEQPVEFLFGPFHPTGEHQHL